MIINEGLESRKLKSGKQRFHIVVKSEPMIFSLSPKELGATVAQGIAHHLREKMRGISAAASPATIRAREVARRALLRGEAWAMKRYGGGKMGVRGPAQSDLLFKDSGRMAESITANAASDGTWRVNVAANRLDPQTANGGVAAVQSIWQRLVQLVPEFQNVGLIIQQNRLLEQTVKNMIAKGRETTGKASAIDVAKAALRLAQTAANLFAS